MSQQNIIVAVDGSETSKKATQWAASLLQEGDDLHIVTAQAGTSAEQEAAAAEVLQSHAALDGVPEARLVKHVLPIPDGASVGATLAEFAQPSKFKLLVVGSRGMGAIRSAIMSLVGLGSVSEDLLERAEVATAVVRQGIAPPKQGAGGRRQILVAVDGSVHSTNALDWTLRHVVHFESDILFLIAVAHRHSEMTAVVHNTAPSGFERVISMRKAAADNATDIAHRAGLAALKAGLPSDQIVCTALDPHSDGFSNEGGSIVKYAGALKMDMIVMGHRGQGAGRGAGSTLAGMGSVTAHCVAHAQCPVIATRFKQTDC